MCHEVSQIPADQPVSHKAGQRICCRSAIHHIPRLHQLNFFCVRLDIDNATGVQTPALAAVLPAAGPTATTGAKTYRCIKGYLVNGTIMTEAQVRGPQRGAVAATLQDIVGYCTSSMYECIHRMLGPSQACTV